MKTDTQVTAGGFVLAEDEGRAFWFVNTLTINKVSTSDTHSQLSIVDHRIPAGFAPPPHVHDATDEALLVLDGDLEGFCGDQPWRAGLGSLVFLPHGIPHCFHTASRTASTSRRPAPAGSSWSPHRADSTSSWQQRASRPGTCVCPTRSTPTRPASPSWLLPTASRSFPRHSPSTRPTRPTPERLRLTHPDLPAESATTPKETIMFTRLTRRESHPRTAARRPAAWLHLLATAVTTVICGLLFSAVIIPAASAAILIPDPIREGGTGRLAPIPATTVHVIHTGGMASSQITLIASGAALAVFGDFLCELVDVFYELVEAAWHRSA